jgi:GTP-binding protein
LPEPLVAIVGRPNVGKSTLFNRLVGGRPAIVERRPGVTRDRLYGKVEWAGQTFRLVDTGGLEPRAAGEIPARVREQVLVAIAEADVVLLVLDAREGLTAADLEIAELVRRSNKPVVPVANKVDDFARGWFPAEFYDLGLGEPVPVSAAQGLNIGELLEAVAARLPATAQAPSEDATGPRVAVVGRPNVGKSSLVNALLGQERVVVTSVPGTTRDAVDTQLVRDGKTYTLIDTAGLRRKARIEETTERYAAARTLGAVARADVVLLVLEAPEGVTAQDKRIAGYVQRQGRAAVVLVNKWDLLSGGRDLRERYVGAVRRELAFMAYAPVLPVSARTGYGLEAVLPAVDRVAEQYGRRVPTPDLNRVIGEALHVMPPPSVGTRRLKVYYASQGGRCPPLFVLFVNDPALATAGYLRYLENRLRESFGLEGTPVRFALRERPRGLRSS